MLAGVSATTFLASAAMQAAFITSVAAAASVPTSSVFINGASRSAYYDLLTIAHFYCTLIISLTCDIVAIIITTICSPEITLGASVDRY